MLNSLLFRYSFDKINSRYISGWCFSRIQPERPISLTIATENGILGQGINDCFRKDLRAKKLHPTGLCGFTFDFPADFNPADHKVLKIYFNQLKIPAYSIACKKIPHLTPKETHPLFFMHIPKTAGSSFNAFTRLLYPHNTYAVHIERLSTKERLALLQNKQYLAGHLPLRTMLELEGLLDRDLYTIIREPWNHLHSHINYFIKIYREVPDQSHLTYQHNDAILKLGARLERINFHSAAEARRFVNEMRPVERNFFDNMQTRYFLDYFTEKIHDQDLENAIKNLKYFKKIGLTECYTDFKNHFCELVGLPSQQETEWENRADSYRLFNPDDPEIRQALLPLVQTDLKLYAHIQQQGFCPPAS